MDRAEQMPRGAGRPRISLGRFGETRIGRFLTTDHPMREMSPLAIGGIVLLLVAVVAAVAGVTLATRSSATTKYVPKTPAAKRYAAATGAVGAAETRAIDALAHVKHHLTYKQAASYLASEIGPFEHLRSVLIGLESTDPSLKNYFRAEAIAAGVLAHNLAVMGTVTPRTHRQWATSTALSTYALRADDAVVRYRLGIGPRPR